jgi:hypothetical protein
LVVQVDAPVAGDRVDQQKPAAALTVGVGGELRPGGERAGVTDLTHEDQAVPGDRDLLQKLRGDLLNQQLWDVCVTSSTARVQWLELRNAASRLQYAPRFIRVTTTVPADRDPVEVEPKRPGFSRVQLCAVKGR